MSIKREELLCGDLAYANAVIAELCGYPKLLLKLEKKTSVHNKKRKIGKRLLVRKNANKYAHELTG
jgi:hypothetical protein